MEVLLDNVSLTCTIIGVIGILYSLIVAGIIKSAPTGTEKMMEIANAVQEGAIAYLNRQLKSMAIVGVVIFIILYLSQFYSDTIGTSTAIGFAIGAIASYLAGYIGMRVSVIANVRTAEAAKQGLAAGLKMAFRGGSVTGMLVASLALTAIAGFYTVLTMDAEAG
ncbi:MAG: sodium/proton-translocating pyrophosphatase, partial [Desulfobacterales bacterium]